MTKRSFRGGKPDQMSMKKHGQCGRATKSPRRRLQERMEAEKNERKARKNPTMRSSIKDLLEEHG